MLRSLFIFTYGLFSDAIGSSDSIGPDCRTMMNNKFKKNMEGSGLGQTENIISEFPCRGQEMSQ
jgi:hypothetical protein